MSGKRIAVVLFNLGGPDSLDAVRPFLFNLFNDPAIISLPGPARWLLASLISRRRAPIAREIYANLGGASPLLTNTKAQAAALEAALSDGTGELRCFVAMRYWHPFADEAARDVAAFDPDRVVLLPLYPQFSNSTSESSLKDWDRAARRAGITAPTAAVCCYPEDSGFVRAMAAATVEAWREAAKCGVPRILFSAHGLPKRNIERGDPYQWQVERSAAAIAAAVAAELETEPDWLVCYQSRVGPLEWIGPYTEAEIERAGRDGRPLVVVPLAFVSEHSETLVELDIEYREKAETCEVPGYWRVSTVGATPAFVDGLAALVGRMLETGPGIESGCGRRICPADRAGCPCR